MIIFRVTYVDAWGNRQRLHFPTHSRAFAFHGAINGAYKEIRESQGIEFDRNGYVEGVECPEPKPTIDPIEFNNNKAGIIGLLDALSETITKERIDK